MKENHFISFISLCLMTSIGLFASDIYLSAFPLIADGLNVSQDLVKLSLTIYLFGLCLCQLFVGYFIGRINKYRLSKLSIGIFILSSLLIMFSSDIYMIYFFRFTQAISAGLLTSMSRIIISQRSAQDKANSSFFAKVYISLGVAPIISPLLGSFIAVYFNWRYIFLFLAILGGVMWFCINYLARFDKNEAEVSHKVMFNQLIRHYKALLARKLFIQNAFIVGSAFLIYFTFVCQAPFILYSIGLSVAYIGLLFVPISITYVMASFWHTRLASRVGVERLVKYGLIIFIFGSSILLITSTLSIHAYWILIPMCIMTFANGFLIPAATFTAMRSTVDIPAASTSLLGFIQLLPPILGTMMLAIWQVKTILGVSLITFVCPLALLFISTLIRKPVQI